MTAAEDMAERHGRMLARYAELSLGLAEDVQAAAVAAEDPDRKARLVGGFHKLGRALRQSIALEAKLARDAEAAQRRAEALAPSPPDPDFSAKIGRIGDLQDALSRIAAAAGHETSEALDALFERFDVELDDWCERPDFLTADLDVLVVAACRYLDLPEELADDWAALPHPDDSPPWVEIEDERAAAEASSGVAPAVHGSG